MSSDAQIDPDETASPNPSAEIASLDPELDFARIVFLLSYQLAPWDIERSLEFALLRTYAIPSISGLLARTREFIDRARKRYDDTELLLAEIGEHGFDHPRATLALDRINAMHGRFKISNDDYLYVLSTFVFNPIEWMSAYGRRPLTEKEQCAWLKYYQTLGQHMGLKDVPPTLTAFRAFKGRFEQEHLVFAESNRQVSGVTIDLVLAMYIPRWMFPLGRPMALALCDDALVDALGARRPPSWLVATVRGAMRLRGALLARTPEPRGLRRITTRKTPTYPHGYDIRGLGTFAPARAKVD